MRVALIGKPERHIRQPEGVVSLRIDPHTGTLAPAEMPDAVSEYFTEDHLPGEEGSAVGTEVAIPTNSSGVSEHDLFYGRFAGARLARA